jgi:hypothetical protein
MKGHERVRVASHPSFEEHHLVQGKVDLLPKFVLDHGVVSKDVERGHIEGRIAVQTQVGELKAGDASVDFLLHGGELGMVKRELLAGDFCATVDKRQRGLHAEVVLRDGNSRQGLGHFLEGIIC